MESDRRITFHCPYCKSHLCAKEEAAGIKSVCPKCEKPISVPLETEADGVPAQDSHK